jgi:hypothetical protein
MAIANWYLVHEMDQRKWRCGYCGADVAGNMGYYRNERQVNAPLQLQEIPQLAYKRIVICPGCEKPTFFDADEQFPGAIYGRSLQHLPPDVAEVYNQSRKCMVVSGYVPIVLAARTLLMHIAVDQGAKAGEHFDVYVDYLVKGGFVPPNAKTWVDFVRVKGNAAAHKMVLMNKDDAEKVLRFVEMILMFVYEYPNIASSP